MSKKKRRKKAKRYINVQKEKQKLNEKFPEYYIEKELDEEKIKQINLNQKWEVIYDEGSLELECDEKKVYIYKYTTTQIQEFESTLDKGAMIEIHDILKKELRKPIFIRDKDRKYVKAYVDGFNNLTNAINAFAGVDKHKEENLFKGVELENEEFNKKFFVESEDELLARMVLNPEMMEKILELQDELGLHMQILYKNKDVYLWIEKVVYDDENRRYKKNIDDSISKVIDNLKEVIKNLTVNENQY